MAKIKICGLFREQDIGFVNQLTPDYVGFIVNYPASHRCVDTDKLKRLKALLSPQIKAVGVFVDEDISTVAELLNDGTIDMAQLHGHEDEEYIGTLLKVAEKPVIKSFVVGEKGVTASAINLSPADFVLIDGGRGGGKPADTEIINKITRPYFLAGGLTPETIPSAIAKYSPYAVDISSGVESDKIKDFEKIKRAVEAARR